MQLQLPHNVRAMSFSGLHAQTQRNCDFFCALSFSKKLHDLTLARREPVTSGRKCGSRLATLEVAFEHHGCNLRCEIGFISTQRFYRGNKVPCRIGFKKESP